MTKTILVTGATGQQGHAVCRSLLDRDIRVRGFTRDPDKAEAEELRTLGVEFVEGDFREPDTLRRAVSDVDGVFIMATPYEQGPDAEEREARNVIDACAAANVHHVVYSSVANADRNTGIPHFDSKARVERYLEQSGLDATVVAPAFFRDNLFAPWLAPGLVEGNLVLPLPTDRRLATVGLDTLGEVFATVLESPSRFVGERIDVAEDEVTPGEMAEALSDAMGRTVRNVTVPIEDVRRDNADMAAMFAWFDDTGYDVDLDRLRRTFPDIAWRSFGDWAGSQDWEALTSAALHA